MAALPAGVDYPNPIPASKMGKPHGHGGRGGGDRGGRGGQRGGGRGGSRQDSRGGSRRDPYQRY